MDGDIRWLQRFDNFERAYLLLKEVRERGVGSLSQLEKEGAVQRFEMAFEAWKTLRDYLEESGVVVEPVTPRNVIKEAFTAKLIDDGQIWTEMMLHRNRLSHTHDVSVFTAVLEMILDRYCLAFAHLHASPSRERPTS